MYTVDPSRPGFVEVPGVLSTDECAALIARIEKLGPTKATVNTTAGAGVQPQVRNNERVIFADEELAQRLFEKARPFVPQDMRQRVLVSANELIRCYRYSPGMRFAPHSDSTFERNDQEKSFYTYLVYLNSDFEGGETTLFMQSEISIRPRAGLGLIFQHPIVHEGCVVKSGIKYVVRTDLMYRRKATA